jgi:predicted Rossmann fold nucleotide-binding protein DprA/Smf involved in DNA uptake
VYTYPELINLDNVERTLASAAKSAPVKQRMPDGMDDKHRKVYELFGDTEVSYDTLVVQSGLSAPELSVVLTELELEGVITVCPGNRYKII